MPFLIGTDEAGYGPNLGPLTVTGTLWETPDTGTDLYQALSASVRQKSKGDGIFVADSKKVYSSGSIKELETSVLSLVYALTGKIPKSWTELAKLVCSKEVTKQFPDQVWLNGRSLELPLKADVDRIKQLCPRGCGPPDALDAHYGRYFRSGPPQFIPDRWPRRAYPAHAASPAFRGR